MYKVDSEVRVVATPPVKKFAGGLYFMENFSRTKKWGTRYFASPTIFTF
ncbi:hypothetical protein Fluta_1359 [Fluviicola taffensis DSM 16823]|uniref:Uncharacterized protein n=1 Tax=Fluviicola taffensis (strain DSM 16823 / NCIMB 13979 / RW262) TaxID=755732 RepID=F2ICY0_FLUTR|nr:hypothetical protein Fluta_1359 [Fluviicola taffensis DSM 16823]